MDISYSVENFLGKSKKKLQKFIPCVIVALQGKLILYQEEAIA